MAESTEYALAVMVSALFVGGSIATYSSFSSFESDLRFRADLATVARLALDAGLNGTSGGAIALPASTISCHGGTLSLSEGSMSGSEKIPFACDFAIALEGGTELLNFSVHDSALNLGVS